MVPNYGHWLTDFRTVFVFALGPDGHKWPFWPFLTIYGHLAIGPWVTNSGKSYKNVRLKPKKLQTWEGKVLEQKQKQFCKL